MLAFALAFSAHAADLSVHLDWTDAPAPLDIVLRDVDAGPLPALTVPAGEGRWRRLEIRISPDGPDTTRFEVAIYEERDLGRGRRASTLVSRPTIVAPNGDEAMVKQGSRTPAREADGVAWTEDVTSLVLRYGEPADEE